MKFTNLFSVAAALAFSAAHAASLTASKEGKTVANVPTEKTSVKVDAPLAKEIKSNDVVKSDKTTASKTTDSKPALSTAEKIAKVIAMGKKFGDLKEEAVKGILTAEEWGRIDYFNNDADLNSDNLTKALNTKPDPVKADIPAETKAAKIFALVPAPKTFGDLSEEKVKGILTADEWGRIDYHGNGEAINKDILVKVIKSS